MPPPSSERTPYETDDGWSPSRATIVASGSPVPARATRPTASRQNGKKQLQEDVDDAALEDGFDVVVRRLPAIERRAGEDPVGMVPVRSAGNGPRACTHGTP